MTRVEYLDVLRRALEGGAFSDIRLRVEGKTDEERWVEILGRAEAIAGPPPSGLRLMPGWGWYVSPSGRRLGFVLGEVEP